VYATGSFGRREASEFSDLDLFIVGKNRIGSDGTATDDRELTRLDEICVKADLIQAARGMDLPEFSGDGRYLSHYSVRELIKTLGTENDDVTNTFTARLLLVLESYPLLEPSVYNDVMEEVIAAYWRDFEDHRTDFMPAFLANDILRLWRTFCVNYEARTSRAPAEEKAKGKLKNYKLKHSRLLTCFSALLYLLGVFTLKRTVTPNDAVEMTAHSPTERLEWLQEERGLIKARPAVNGLLQKYERFLETTNSPEQDLVRQFMDKDASREFMNAAYEFGDAVFDALSSIGSGSRFHRLLVV
jgi:hypothetical protein